MYYLAVLGEWGYLHVHTLKPGDNLPNPKLIIGWHTDKKLVEQYVDDQNDDDRDEPSPIELKPADELITTLGWTDKFDPPAREYD